MTGNLTRKQFDVLEILEKEKRWLTQQKLEEKTGFSLGTVNRLVKEMSEKGWLLHGKITDSGLSALEPYRVSRAVFLAAGFGERMMPVTLNTPKPLIRVKGKRIIDGLIDAMLNVGISEIYVVRGYLAKQFDQLLDKYPMIKFIDNPEYSSANSIASAKCAGGLMGNAYVCESDLLLHNSNLIKKYHYSTNFLGFYTDRTDDWCFEVKNGIIQKQKMGGVNCWQEIGISYWTAEDALKLVSHIETAYCKPGGRELHWEALPFERFAKEYRIQVRECLREDVTEIDTYQELQAIDPLYR